MIRILPLIIIEIYLATTLMILAWGPVSWRLQNTSTFWTLIVMYHLAFIVGYIIPAKCEKSTNNYNMATDKRVIKHYWIFLLLAFIASLISYKNVVQSPSYIPLSFFSDFFIGLFEPGLARKNYFAAKKIYKSDTIVTMIMGSFIFIKYSLLPALIYLWPKLNWKKKYIGFFIAMMPVISIISIGKNKLTFDTLFILFISLLVVFFSAKAKERLHALKQRKFILVSTLILIIFAPYYFNQSINARVPNFKYMENKSNPGDVVVSTEKNSFFVKTSVYLVQGYYGMSLAIDEPFESTYGFGNSFFLLGQLKKVFSIDLIPRTFQHKVSHLWNRLEMWHSFYSQVANDVSFYGVTGIMFCIGLLLSLVYRAAIMDNCLVSKILIPLYAMIFIYMPANNQVFNMMETLFSFLFLQVLWFLIRLRKMPKLFRKHS